MHVERIGSGTKTYWPTDLSAGDFRQPARRDEPAVPPVESAREVAASGLSAATQVPVAVPAQRSSDDTSPPFGGLPNTRSVLSTLTPADRAAIAGATGYHLSPSGEITNPGGLPPWSFILGYAEQRRSQPAEDSKPLYASSVADGVERPESSGRVDVVA